MIELGAMWVLFSIIWVALGILAWGWANHCIHLNNPDEDKNPLKWLALLTALIFGPLMFIVNILLGTHKLTFGLRFK